MFRAITRTVLFDQAAASSSMNRVDDTSDACARSPARAPFTVTSSSDVAPGARLGRSHDTSAANSRRPERNRLSDQIKRADDLDAAARGPLLQQHHAGLGAKLGDVVEVGDEAVRQCILRSLEEGGEGGAGLSHRPVEHRQIESVVALGLTLEQAPQQTEVDGAKEAGIDESSEVTRHL